MLCFLFAALIVALDQFFKHWIVRTIDIGGVWTNEAGNELIPGVLGLTRWENDGAMLNILSGQQWLLAGIAFGAAIILVMILLRYNEGFWGTLGLAAVLGGTVGNLIDRIFNDGKVIDMFRTLFIDFPIFNIADIFITLGFITFLIHFIVISFASKKPETGSARYADRYSDRYNDYDYPAESGDAEYDEFPDIGAIVSAQAEHEVVSSPAYNDSASATQVSQHTQVAHQDSIAREPILPMPDDYQPLTETTPDISYSLDDLTAELESLEDYSVDDLLREYGYSDDDFK